MSKIITKTDRQLAAKVEAIAESDPVRARVLTVARKFKRSWLELAEALSEVDSKDLWNQWGFRSLTSYAQSELHIKPATTGKLLASFRYLHGNAPRVLERAKKPDAPVPSMQVVDFVARAKDRGAADEKTLAEITKAAFDEGASAGVLTKRYKSLAFPTTPSERKQTLNKQIVRAINRLTTLLADPDANVPHQETAVAEQALGRILDAIDDKSAN